MHSTGRYHEQRISSEILASTKRVAGHFGCGTIIYLNHTHVGLAGGRCAESLGLVDDGLLSEKDGEIMVISDIELILCGIGQSKGV